MAKRKSQHLQLSHDSWPKKRQPDAVTPFIIINFSHHEHLHLPKDHVVAFAEKDSNEGEVLEICTMEQLEKEIPRNWIPARK